MSNTFPTSNLVQILEMHQNRAYKIEPSLINSERELDIYSNEPKKYTTDSAVIQPTKKRKRYREEVSSDHYRCVRSL
jgi:hypothetical protein